MPLPLLLILRLTIHYIWSLQTIPKAMSLPINQKASKNFWNNSKQHVYVHPQSNEPADIPINIEDFLE